MPRAVLPRARAALRLCCALACVAFAAAATRTWPGDAVLAGIPADTCRWKDVRPPESSTSYRMCLRGDDLLSNNIYNDGYWVRTRAHTHRTHARTHTRARTRNRLRVRF
jgi:hypothetical protein